MKAIRNKEDLKIAYFLLEMHGKHGLDTQQAKEAADELKREVRRYQKRDQGKAERRIIKSEDDGYTELMQLPESLKTEEEAREYFEEYERRDIVPSAYDCTGQLFTVWFKVFRRRGRMWAYHRIAMDV